MCTVTHANIFFTEGCRQRVQKLWHYTLLYPPTFSSSPLPTISFRASKLAMKISMVLSHLNRIKTDLKGTRKFVKLNIYCKMKETRGFLLSFSLKLVWSWRPISSLLFSPLLMMHKVGHKQREASSLRNVTGAIAHL